MFASTQEEMNMIISGSYIQTLIDKEKDEFSQLYESNSTPDCSGLVQAVLEEIEKNHTDRSL